MSSKSSNTPGSSDVCDDVEILMHGENKSKPNSTNTIGAVNNTDCQDGAYKKPLEEKLPSKVYNMDELLGVSRAKMPVQCPGVEKAGNSSSTKPPQYPRQRTNEYIRSRLGHPEGLSGVNAVSQLGNSSKRKGQVFDDREELITAAASAHSARQQACSDPLWERIETVFAPIATEDVVQLKQTRNARNAAILNAIHFRVSDDEHIRNIIMKASLPRTEQSSLEQGSVSSATSSSRLDIAKTDHSVPTLFQRTLSALIVEDEIEPLEGIQPEHRLEVNQSELDGHVTIPGSFSTSEQNQADDGSHLIREFNNCDGLDIIMPPNPNDQMSPTSSSDDLVYQMLALDNNIFLEIQSLNLNPQTLPHSEVNDGQIYQEIRELQERLYQQASTRNNELKKIEKAIEHEQSLEKRATEEVAYDKLVEIAYKKMPLRGRITQPSTRNRSNTSTQKDLEFVERTLQRNKEFEETGRSCFNEPNLQEAMFPKENIQQNSTDLNGVSKRRKTRPSASTSDSDMTVEKKKRKTSRVQTVVNVSPPPPSTETEQVVSNSSEPVYLPSRKGKEKVDDGMLIGASEIINEQNGGIKHKRRYTKRKTTRITSTLSNSSSSVVVAPINTEEYLTGTRNQQPTVLLQPQNVAKCGETSAAKVKKVDDFFSKDFEKLCMEKDYDILLQTNELDNLNGVGKPEDLKTFIDFLEEDPTMDFTCPLDVPLDDLFDVDAALSKGW